MEDRPPAGGDNILDFLYSGRGGILKFNELRNRNFFSPKLAGTCFHEADLHEADLHDADMGNADLSGADLSDANLSGGNLSGADLSGANLARSDLSGANLSGADLSGANLSGAKFAGVDLSDADLSGVNLRGADLSGVHFSGARLRGADLTGANLRGASLAVTDLSGVPLGGTDLGEVNLTGADLRGAYLGEANLRGAYLGKANLVGANLSIANLIEANLRFADLTEADLTGADLTKASLIHADLTRANLAGTRFGEADLAETNLAEADFASADLTRACLVGASLRGANLARTSLREADLAGCDLSGANLAGADLTGADLDVADEGNPLRRLIDRQFPLPGVYAAPFILDGHSIRGTRFSFTSRDPWSILRRTYTGSRMAFIVLATATGFLPLIAQALFWIAVAVAERRGIEAMLGPLEESSRIARGLPDPGARAWADEAEPAWDRLRSQLDGQPGSPFVLDLKPAREAVERGREALIEVRSNTRSRLTASQARDLETAASNLAEARRAFALVRPERAHVELRPHRIIALLLGWSEGFWPFLLAITALSYNLARFILTFFFVVPLRDESDRNQRAPKWSDYKPLWHAHQVLSVLVLVTYVSLAILIATKVVPALWMKVLVPVRMG